MAHLKTKETRNDAVARKDWKFKLTRSLYERGYDRQDILNLFRFIDWILELPEDLRQSFRDELEKYEQEKQMPYVTSIERMGIEQGIEQGEDRATQKIALKMLQENIPLEVIARITGLTIDRLQQLQALPAKD
jgi:predicted transposase/invertase (TIGR01784 family)